jgi:SNF2 family DNA or RNA helicase
MNFKPMKHQQVSLKHDAKSELVFDTSDPGTGKTYVRIMGFAGRRAKGGGAMLVLAPRSLLRNVWANDVRKFAGHLTTSVADAANRERSFAAEADIYITNIDAAAWLVKQKPAFFKRFSELVLDESDAFKHHTSIRSKSLLKISKYFKRRILMSGTPNTNSITDIWHQAMILDGGQRLGSSFYKFRDTVCQPTQVGRSAQMVKWHDKEGAEEAVFGLLADLVIRHKFDDCVDIPETHKYTLDYDLTPKQLQSYLELEATAMLTFSSKTGQGLSAINAAAVATKLLQVSSGAVYYAPESYHIVDTGRYEMILDLIEQRKQTLCFFLWKHQRDMLVAEATKRGLKFSVFDGDASDQAREDMVTSFQAGVTQVMFAHPASAGHGLTLTSGDTTIWPCPTYNLGHFVQGNRRVARLGQTKKTEVIVIVAKGTLEEKVYNMLLDKDVRMTTLLELFSTLNKAPTKRIKETA